MTLSTPLPLTCAASFDLSASVHVALTPEARLNTHVKDAPTDAQGRTVITGWTLLALLRESPGALYSEVIGLSRVGTYALTVIHETGRDDPTLLELSLHEQPRSALIRAVDAVTDDIEDSLVKQGYTAQEALTEASNMNPLLWAHNLAAPLRQTFTARDGFWDVQTTVFSAS